MNKNRAEAIEKGHITYEGNRCKKCKTTLKYTSGARCVLCKRQKAHLLYFMSYFEGDACGFCNTTVKIKSTGKCKKCSDAQKKQIAEHNSMTFDRVLSEHKSNLQLSCQRW